MTTTSNPETTSTTSWFTSTLDESTSWIPTVRSTKGVELPTTGAKFSTVARTLPDESNPGNTGLIAGATVAALAVILFILVCCCVKTKRCCGRRDSSKPMTPMKRLQRTFNKHRSANNQYVASPPPPSVTQLEPKLADSKKPLEDVDKTLKGHEDEKDSSAELVYKALVGGGTDHHAINIEEKPSSKPESAAPNIHDASKGAAAKKDHNYYNYQDINPTPDDQEKYMSMDGVGSEKELYYITKDGPKYTNVNGIKNSDGKDNEGYVNANEEDEQTYENTDLHKQQEEYYNMNEVRKNGESYLDDVVGVTDSVIDPDRYQPGYIGLRE